MVKLAHDFVKNAQNGAEQSRTEQLAHDFVNNHILKLERFCVPEIPKLKNLPKLPKPPKSAKIAKIAKSAKILGPLEVRTSLCAQECPPEVREHLEVRTILCIRTCRHILVHPSPKCPRVFLNRQKIQICRNRQKGLRGSQIAESPGTP